MFLESQLAPHEQEKPRCSTCNRKYNQQETNTRANTLIFTRSSWCEVGACSPLYEVGKQDAVRVALPSDLSRLQNSSVSQLNQDLLPVELVGLAIVVWFDTANKVRLPCHHLGKQVHQRVLEKV